jgi:hypothetical protein
MLPGQRRMRGKSSTMSLPMRLWTPRRMRRKPSGVLEFFGFFQQPVRLQSVPGVHHHRGRIGKSLIAATAPRRPSVVEVLVVHVGPDTRDEFHRVRRAVGAVSDIHPVIKTPALNLILRRLDELVDG